MYTYIKQSIPGYYFKPNEPLTEQNCLVLGETFEDFLNNKFVPLNENQIKFAEENPKASIKEIFEMQLEQHEPTLEDIKLKKIYQLESYDNNLNDFIINDSIHAWFTPTERADYKQSIESAKLMNIEILQFFANNILLEIETSKAEQMLALVQLYANKCFIVTKQHKINIEQAKTIEEVENYNFREGYPDKLRFQI